MADPRFKVTEDGAREDPGEVNETIVGIARRAVRAFYLSNGAAFQQAMDDLNAAFTELDGIDYREFGASE